MKLASIDEYKQQLEQKGLRSEEIDKRVSLASKFQDWIKNSQEKKLDSAAPRPNLLAPQGCKPVLRDWDGPPSRHLTFFLYGGIIATIIGSFFIFSSYKSNPQNESKSYIPNTRTLSFSGKLTDFNGNIIAEKTQVILSLYNGSNGSNQLYSSGVCKVIPNIKGEFETTIGRACGSPIREDVFTKNTDIYLGIRVANDPEMTPRTQVTTNSQQTTSNTLADKTIPVIDENGDVTLGQNHPGIRSTMESANFAISSANGILLQSAQNGDITLSATESGQIKFLVGGEQVVQIKNNGDIALTGNIEPSLSGIATIGTSNNRFKSLYVDNIYPGLFGISGYLKRDGNTLSTTNLGDELILGAASMPNARIRFSPFTTDTSWINAGNFGIGTTNPTFNLEVNGSTRINGDTILGASSSPKVLFNSATLSFINPSAISLPGNTINALAFQTDMLSLDTQNNRIGIGTISPSNKLTIADSQANMSTLWVENRDSGASANGISIKLGFTGAGNTSNNFITFIKGNGEVQGKIKSNSASGIEYSTTGGDFAEYFLKDSSLDSSSADFWEAGTLVCLVSNAMVRPCDETYTTIIGVISKNAGFVGNSKGENDERYTLVGLVGQLPIRVEAKSEKIHSGDALTFSSTPGVAIKATVAGRIIGFAKENYAALTAGLIQSTIQPGYFSLHPVQEVQPVALLPTQRPTLTPMEPEPTSTKPLSSFLIKGLQDQTIASIDEAGNASFSGTLQAQSVQTQEASVSGTLTASRVEASNITDIEKMINDIKNQSLPDPRLYEKNTSVLKELAPIDSLTVLGKSNLYDVSVANSFMAGNVSIANDTITGLSFELKLNALSTINLLDGAVIIAKDGTLTTKGLLIAEKGIRTSSINASGSVYFAQGIHVDTFIADKKDTQSESALTAAITTNAQSAGDGEIPAGKSNVIIYNDKLSKNSLVYLTSTSKTNNQPVYVSVKHVCGDSSATPQNDTCKKYFIVTIDSPIDSAATFNWWIIN